MYIEKIQVPLPLHSLNFTPHRLLHISFDSNLRIVALLLKKHIKMIGCFTSHWLLVSSGQDDS
jgi:hypothetical protein